MIFRPGAKPGPAFMRIVRLEKENLRILDEFAPSPGVVAVPGPRQNMRHVASADSFSAEEWQEMPEPLRVALDSGYRHVREVNIYRNASASLG